jgi:hypothetical protein
MAQAITKDPTWYRPVCDQLFERIKFWYTHYERGAESASRSFVTLNGRIVDRTTMYAHVLQFKPLEIDHLVRLLKALSPHPELASDFERVRAGMLRGRLRPGGTYDITLNFYKEDVADILTVLLRARSGQLKTLEEITAEKATEGKGLFE